MAKEGICLSKRRKEKSLKLKEVSDDKAVKRRDEKVENYHEQIHINLNHNE